MNKKIIVLQDGIKECGSACLLSIIRYYGGNVSLDRILELTSTTKEGTTFYNIKDAAEYIGLDAKGYKSESLEELSQIEKPFISQIVINNLNHFVVVYKIKKDYITVMDPAKGMIRIKVDDYKKIWTGYILLLEPYKKLPIYSQNNYINNIIYKTIFIEIK